MRPCEADGLVLRLPQGETADPTEAVGEVELADGGGRQATIRSWSAERAGGDVSRLMQGRRRGRSADRPVTAAAAFELRRRRQLQPLFLTRAGSVVVVVVVSMWSVGLACD